MKNKVQISIPTPCHENWDAMTPAQQGRLCGACQKTVIDFTLMTDGQILDVIKRANGHQPCGRYLPSQLDRELIDNRPKATFIGVLAKRMAAMLLLVQSATTAMAQQAKSHMVTVEQYEEDNRDARGRIQVTGKLINSETKLPVPYMSVYITQTDTTVFADSAGRYSFSMPAELDTVTVLLNQKLYGENQATVTLTSSLIFPKQTIAINKTKNGGEMTVYISYMPITSFYNPVRMEIMGTSMMPMIQPNVICNYKSFTIAYVTDTIRMFKLPSAKFTKQVASAHSEKTVWGRLANYWAGKDTKAAK